MMTRSGKWLTTTLALAALVFLALSPSAHAVLTLNAVETGGPTLNVIDNNSPDTNPAVGNITLANGTTFGDFTVNGSISTSNSTGPIGPLGQVASSSLTVINNTSAAHTITLMISDTDFHFPGPPVQVQGTASGTFSPTTGTGNTQVGGAAALAQAFIDNTNTLFGTQVTVQSSTAGPAAPGAGLLSYNFTSTPVTFTFGPNGYSMTVKLTFTVPGFSQLNGRSDVIQTVGNVIPEPGSMALAFTGLGSLGLGCWARRRRNLS